jgi:acetyl-CoA acetyltransferase
MLRGCQGRDRRRDAGDGRALSRPHPKIGRRHRGRPLLVHDPCPPRRRGDRFGLCETVLITHGESGRSGVGCTRNVVAPTSLAGQFEQRYGPMGPPTLFTIPVLRYMKTCGLTREQLAIVSVVQREWAAMNPRATFKTPITVDDVLNSRMIAYPFRLLQCCLVTDGGGALILVAAERARELPAKAGLPPRYRREGLARIGSRTARNPLAGWSNLSFRGERGKVRNRRVSSTAIDLRERPLTEPTAAAQPSRREALFMPHCSHV